MNARAPRLVWAPRALFALAVLHCLVVVTDVEWLDIIDRGLVGVAAHDDPLVRAEAGFTLYFAVTGVLMFALADAAASQVSATHTLPPRFGWYVLTAGLLILLVQFPINGGWLVVTLGVAVVVLDRRNTQQQQHNSAPRHTSMEGLS